MALRRRLPGARIVVAGHREALNLLVGSTVDEALRFDDRRLAPLFGCAPAPIETVDLLARIEGVVAWLADAAPIAPAIGSLGLRLIAADPQPPAPSQSPAMSGPGWRRAAGGAVARHLVRSLRPLGVVEDPALYCAPLLTPTTAGIAEVSAARCAAGVEGAGPVVVHPGSGGVRKRWPPDAVAELVDRLRALGERPILLAGPADGGAIAAIESAAGGAPVLSGLSLAGVLGLVARARGYVGMDSGISHLAGLAGTRTVAIFGPSDSRRWAPCGPNVRVVDAARTGCPQPCQAGEPCGCLAVLPAETVLTALAAPASGGPAAT